MVSRRASCGVHTHEFSWETCLGAPGTKACRRAPTAVAAVCDDRLSQSLSPSFAAEAADTADGRITCAHVRAGPTWPRGELSPLRSVLLMAVRTRVGGTCWSDPWQDASGIWEPWDGECMEDMDPTLRLAPPPHLPRPAVNRKHVPYPYAGRLLCTRRLTAGGLVAN